MRLITLLPGVVALSLAGCLASEPAQQLNELNSLGEDTPVYFTAPPQGFTSSGTVDVTVRVAKGFYEQSILSGPGDVILIATVDGCSTVTPLSIQTDGTVTPVATNPHGGAVEGYLWTVTLDLGVCQCVGSGTTRTHHCDGCGHTFDTCETSGATCEARAATVVVDAYDRPDNNKCTLHDFNGDAITDCDLLSGSLSPGAGSGGETELWVPPPFWTDGNTVCIRRAGPNNACHPVGNPGGQSCD